MLTFYYATNTCALASHIALEEAGADYEARWIDFGAAEQTKPDYLKINPKGRVPSLMTERGVLTETPAILAYVAQTHAAAQLAPLDDPFAFAELQSFIGYLCSTVHVAHAHRARGYRWADDPAAIEAMKKKVPQSVGACFDLIERKMFRGPWAMGENYTVADPTSSPSRGGWRSTAWIPPLILACSTTATGWQGARRFSARSKPRA
jgi:glutathione S-transferase